LSWGWQSTGLWQRNRRVWRGTIVLAVNVFAAGRGRVFFTRFIDASERAPVEGVQGRLTPEKGRPPGRRIAVVLAVALLFHDNPAVVVGARGCSFPPWVKARLIVIISSVADQVVIVVSGTVMPFVGMVTAAPASHVISVIFDAVPLVHEAIPVPALAGHGCVFVQRR